MANKLTQDQLELITHWIEHTKNDQGTSELTTGAELRAFLSNFGYSDDTINKAVSVVSTQQSQDSDSQSTEPKPDEPKPNKPKLKPIPGTDNTFDIKRVRNTVTDLNTLVPDEIKLYKQIIGIIRDMRPKDKKYLASEIQRYMK